MLCVGRRVFNDFLEKPRQTNSPNDVAVYPPSDVIILENGELSLLSIFSDFFRDLHIFLETVTTSRDTLAGLVSLVSLVFTP